MGHEALVSATSFANLISRGEGTAMQPVSYNARLIETKTAPTETWGEYHTSSCSLLQHGLSSLEKQAANQNLCPKEV